MADERTYYVICADNCKFEGMTKEQILTAIEQAISTGKIHNVDSGFVTKIKELNRNTALSFWVGTQAEYNALEEAPKDCFCIITDDTTAEDIARAINEMQRTIETYTAAIPPLPQITVTLSHWGKVICTDENGKETVSTKQVDNVWTFNVPHYGAYTITGTYNGVTRTATVDVTAVQQYATEIIFYDEVFAKNSWEVINELCEAKKVPATWEVGDSKAVIGTNNVTYYAQIIGKNHDEYENGETAPLTFMLQSFSGDKMNANATTAGGWSGSKMRTETMSNVINSFAELKSVVKNVKKYTSKGKESDGTISAEIETTLDKFFLLSEKECKGSTEKSFDGEGTQYEYFRNGNNATIKSDQNMWLRSPSKTSGENFCAIKKRSDGNNNYIEYVDEDSAAYVRPMYPVFCL